MTNFAIFRRFRLNLGVFNASAEGASVKFRVFYRGAAYNVIIFKIQGGGNSPPAPLLTPMSNTYTFSVLQHIGIWIQEYNVHELSLNAICYLQR